MNTPSRDRRANRRTLLGLACAAVIWCVTAVAQAAPSGEVVPPAQLPAQSPAQQPAGEPIRRSSHTSPVGSAAALVEQAGSEVREPLRKGAPRNATAPIEQKTRLGNPESAASRTNVAGPGRTRSVTSILGALAGVLGLFFVVTWVLRRSLPQSSQRLPSEVVEVLGHAPLGQRQQAQLIRLGHKLLLVSVTPTGAETLSEVTDPAEVSRLTSLCRGRGPAGAPLRFRNVLEQLKERSAPGSPGRPAASSVTTRTSAQEGARG